jgi:hypothetical protein
MHWYEQISTKSAIFRDLAIDFLAQLYPFLGGPADLRPLLR